MIALQKVPGMLFLSLQCWASVHYSMLAEAVEAVGYHQFFIQVMDSWPWHH